MKLEASLNYFKKRRNKVQLMEEECAIYALEKQIPKKPILDSRTCRYVDYQEFFCPYCRNRIISRLDGDFIAGRKQKHCDNCGQALDWSEAEE